MENNAVFDQRPYSPDDLRHLARHKVIFGGEPEPEWLRRNAAVQRRLQELKREGRTAPERRTFFRRFAFVFGRS
jgi:hypothetical protein